MADSAWIVFLPLIGAILGAVVGAFGGAMANSWYRNRETKKARDEERKALLLLLDAELDNNAKLLNTFYDDLMQDRQDTKLPPLDVGVWEGTRVQLAELLPADHVKALVDHYAVLADIEMVRRGQAPGSIREVLIDIADDAASGSKRVRARADKYLKGQPDGQPARRNRDK